LLPEDISTFMGAITIRLSIWQFPILMGWNSSGWEILGVAFRGALRVALGAAVRVALRVRLRVAFRVVLRAPLGAAFRVALRAPVEDLRLGFAMGSISSVGPGCLSGPDLLRLRESDIIIRIDQVLYSRFPPRRSRLCRAGAPTGGTRPREEEIPMLAPDAYRAIRIEKRETPT
jgi:hypothetical protein